MARLRGGGGAERPAGPVTTPQWPCHCSDRHPEPRVLGRHALVLQLTGEQIGKDKQLGCDPCSVKRACRISSGHVCCCLLALSPPPAPRADFSNGDYLVVAGLDRKATLMTRDGIRLNTVAEAKDWVWRAVPRPKTELRRGGLQRRDHQHAQHRVLHGARAVPGRLRLQGCTRQAPAFAGSAACRSPRPPTSPRAENMTDVGRPSTSSQEQRARIECREYIKKIAVYRDRLAVQVGGAPLPALALERPSERGRPRAS